MTRDHLLARVSDILRRSGVEDAEGLCVELERQTEPPNGHPSLTEAMAWMKAGGEKPALILLSDDVTAGLQPLAMDALNVILGIPVLAYGRDSR